MEEEKENSNIRQRIEKHARKRLKPVIDILDRGDDMRKEGTLTHAQIAKETAIQAAYLTGVVGTFVSAGAATKAAYDHLVNKPDKPIETILPASPAHTTKTPQQFIKEFEDKNLGGKGHAEKIEGGKEAPVKSR